MTPEEYAKLHNKYEEGREKIKQVSTLFLVGVTGWLLFGILSVVLAFFSIMLESHELSKAAVIAGVVTFFCGMAMLVAGYIKGKKR